MPFQSVPDCAEVNIITTCNGEVISFNPKFRFTGGTYGESDIEALAGAVDAWVGAEVLDLLTTSQNYLFSDARGLENENDWSEISATNTGLGTAAATPIPNNNAFVIKFSSPFTGRSARGRVYVGALWPAILDTNENTVTAAFADAWVAAWEALNSHVNPEGWTHVVVSRRNNNVLRAEGVAFNVTTYSYTDLIVDSQRRRLPSN